MHQYDPAEPSPPTAAKDRILDAAELEFAEFGFAGANLRSIAEGAGVAPTLVHYHFGGKVPLFDAVVRRRAEIINERRLETLRAMRDPGLEEILYALFRPALDHEAGGAAFARISAALAFGGQESQLSVATIYDPVAHVFIDAIRAAAPPLNREQATRGYILSLGTLVAAMARSGRAERLMGGRIDDDAALSVGMAVRYAAAGVEALAREAAVEQGMQPV